MTKEQKQAVFEPLSKNFETDSFRKYFMDMVAEVPSYIFTMPSSTSGKFHNATQCQTYGQIYHVYMFDSILNHRLRLKGNKEKYSTPPNPTGTATSLARLYLFPSCEIPSDTITVSYMLCSQYLRTYLATISYPD